MNDVIIVGAGVAGWTASLYLARRGLKVLVIGKDVGGQANYTDAIENYPGVEEIGGLELSRQIRKQAEKHGVEFLQGEVGALKAGPNCFVTSAYGRQYKSAAVILAYGKTPQDLGIPGEEQFKGRGVSYCATCDAPLFKNKVVAVVGIGDIAADCALLLSKSAKKILVLSKTDKFVAHPQLSKALFKKPNVELVGFAQVQEIYGDQTVKGMKLLNTRTETVSSLAVDGIFVELGYVVNSQMVANIVKLDDRRQVIVNADQQTSVLGIFAAGDCTNRNYKQAVISAGEAATAALACYDWLQQAQGAAGITSDWTQIKRIKN
ncbi:MAG: hypothetical protein A3J07_00555 [Candidatus Doudnabacteria bacterium RIFCSPLOWO2_02_FULL_49_13]|uniref:FAD/NAD(P)-binding domain-containing protein n=1 Tax=Candidatus Doudnabacteria bacterium RIFCSPHIGHO2_12_FULL_48_16 TaxID=1817838 RepID=A0A1F5PJW8_9BACT|nr:MAG: hypothetical protein A3B77_03470 [Candidatus Doudnabacteria bacterium RIFCSPHIGHO2_02_FULL_49_24]OGE88497.1 MAG: hypothetical protein A2760_00205 [Candidatus Doudnabacteria bacterium RIFCSPHIGHO2_01_FULL_50_67]OGE90245.1 MAG: hypothetical protein A3E29_04065 [Candidatus Doudnabacteria bacterium RIFCSPHIGHO2_12_FULL_48_16]OGE96901.1 MAG: hypothetical protein A2990_03855 [Candidatus Doudnabacteria bacterium RIFCSPLOWO2_01_FULL_49_40]OGF02301.1 MAG: hypothetical protein A3J07_00555 [Candid